MGEGGGVVEGQFLPRKGPLPQFNWRRMTVWPPDGGREAEVSEACEGNRRCPAPFPMTLGAVSTGADGAMSEDDE